MLIVTEDRVDLRAEPLVGQSATGKDPEQLTQLIYGENVRLLDERPGWSYVEAVEQQQFADGHWRGYTGWVQSQYLAEVPDQQATHVVASFAAPAFSEPSTVRAPIAALSMGVHVVAVYAETGWTQVRLADGRTAFVSSGDLRSLSESTQWWRQQLIDDAQHFLGSAYFWGGRSVPNQVQHPRSGIDCSGLTNLLYRVAGIDIPRDAHDQYLASSHMEPSGLEPGDLVFSVAKADGPLFDHVMLYKGGDVLIEASMEAGCAREVSFKEKFTCSLIDLRNGGLAPQHRLAFGRASASR